MSLRAARLGGADTVEILAETDLDTVCATLEAQRPDVCVIDSVQTLHASGLGSAPGSVAQVREAAGRLLRVAKEAGVATVLVGHVTKDGAVAGPRVLEHLVDCVLQFEGDRYHEHRVLRATKNRFGSTNELGVFEMTAAGLVGVPDPSELFGTTHPGEVGAAVGCALEGTRPILLEVQALVASTRPRDAATRGYGRRSQATRHDRRGARTARRRLACQRGRVRERRGRHPYRGAGCRPRGCPGDCICGARRAGARGARGIRGDRLDRPTAPGVTGGAAARGVREARDHDRRRTGRGDPLARLFASLRRRPCAWPSGPGSSLRRQRRRLRSCEETRCGSVNRL